MTETAMTETAMTRTTTESPSVSGINRARKPKEFVGG
jgi:hypothetical protein